MRERGKLWIRYVPEAREYMRKEKKEEIGMCQRQVNTCEKGENYGLGMCERQVNTCEKRKKKK